MWRLSNVPVLIFALTLLSTDSAHTASPPPIQAESGLVAADHELASQVGVQILQAGGNAADAAIATTFALGVVNPMASGIGGGGFVLYYDRATDQVIVIDFRERAPALATRDMFIVDGVFQPELSVRSGLAVGVPGEVAGLWALHQRYGSLPWADLVAPAIELAEDGFEVGAFLAGRLVERSVMLMERPDLMRQLVNEDNTFVGISDVLTRPGLAQSLRAIAEHGPEAFYTGHIAEEIVDAVNENGGVMTLDDLETYEITDRQPIVGSYDNYTFYAMPPPSSGGTTLLSTLNILQPFDLPAMGHNSSSYVHILAEAMQYTFADRAMALGDSDYVDVPVLDLIDVDLGLERFERIVPDRTFPAENYGPLLAPPTEEGGTTHLSIVDSNRNMVALTSTINLWFGSMIVAGDTGIILNDEMDDFSAQPGVPNAFGLVGAEANAIESGKRPLSSMTPTLIFRDGEPFMTIGASGGPRIITATLQTVLNVVEFEMDISEAISAPRIHHQWIPQQLFFEWEFPLDVRDNLAARGHVLTEVESLAAVQAIVVDGTWLYGASDPRKSGSPMGY